MAGRGVLFVKDEWMLGVFALTPDGQASGPDPTLFLQLAISKEGIVNGTLNNSTTDTTQTIEGMADKASQRAAWTVAGQRGGGNWISDILEFSPGRNVIACYAKGSKDRILRTRFLALVRPFQPVCGEGVIR